MKKTRKIIAVLLVLVFAVSMAACGNSGKITGENEEASGMNESSETETESGNVITQYLEKGYEVKSFSTDGDYDFHAVMYSEKKDDYKYITLRLTDDEIRAFDKLNADDEKYEEKETAWLKSLTGEAKTTDMGSMIPSAEELDKLKGKTGAQLDDMGYMMTGYGTDEENNLYLIYSYYNSKDIMIDLAVYFEGTEGKTMDDISDNQISSMTVTQAEFDAFE